MVLQLKCPNLKAEASNFVQVTVASYGSKKAAGAVSSQRQKSGCGQALALVCELVSELLCFAYASLFTGKRPAD